MNYNPEASPPMSDSDSDTKPPMRRRALRSIMPNEQPKPTSSSRHTKPASGCSCDAQLTELRKEVSELTKTINEMSSIIHAKLLFPHLSLAEALAGEAEVSYAHVKPPKRPRTDSALYLPDIPDGFSDSTAHSLVFRRRTKATTTEQECKVAFKKLSCDAEADTIVVKGVKPPVKSGRVVKRTSARTRAARRG